MSDNDRIICLDSDTGYKNDAMKRVSFGRSSLRKSISQPNLHKLPVNDEKEDVQISTQAAALISPRKKGRTPKARVIEKEFFGVYCLISRSENKNYKNRCYIGYTVDPNRRISQHNGGKDKGGAKKTDSRGPWDMVCVVTGFPNNVTALRFEWAWQNPEKSKSIRHLQLKKTRKETPFAFRLRIACHLLNCNPWKNFALNFRWLLPSEELPFPELIKPPIHMGKDYGLVLKSTITISDEEKDYEKLGNCRICSKEIQLISHLGRCLSYGCGAHYHLQCIAVYGQGTEEDSQLYPVRISCLSCYSSSLWGDMIRDQRALLKIAEANESNYTLRGLVHKKIDFIH